MKNVRFIGLDVHAETIAVAVAEPDGEVRSSLLSGGGSDAGVGTGCGA